MIYDLLFNVCTNFSKLQSTFDELRSLAVTSHRVIIVD